MSASIYCHWLLALQQVVASRGVTKPGDSSRPGMENMQHQDKMLWMSEEAQTVGRQSTYARANVLPHSTHLNGFSLVSTQCSYQL